jgi:hypothetical protein
VLAASSGQPLALATVEIPALKRSTVTDAEGRFRLDRIPAGEHALRVTLVGYREHSRPVPNGAGAVEVRLGEDPVLLQGLTVTSNRFDRRIQAVPYAVRVFGAREVAGSAATDAARFVITQTGMIPVRCRSVVQDSCFYVRGELTRPVVYINDALAPAGMNMLEGIDRSVIARVEVVQGGRYVRVYTDDFMAWAARNNYRPLPLAAG